MLAGYTESYPFTAPLVNPAMKSFCIAKNRIITGETLSSVAQALGVAATQVKTWRLEQQAAGSAEAVARRRAEASELQQLRRDNKRLQEENEILRKASAFFARWAEKA